LEQDNRARRELTLEQRSALAERDRQLQALQREAGEKEQQVQALQREAGEKEQQVQALQKEGAEKELIVQTLRAEVCEKEQRVQVLQNEVKEKEQQMQAFRAEEGGKARGEQKFRVEIQEKERLLAELNAQVSDLQKQLSLVEVDYGWRLLRKAKKVRSRLAPPGSRRDRWFLQGLHFAVLTMSTNPLKLFRRGPDQSRYRVPVGAPAREVAKQETPTTTVLPQEAEASTVEVRTEGQGWGNQVLVISGSTGDMERYRCHHIREQLQLFGVSCEMRHIADRQALALLDAPGGILIGSGDLGSVFRAAPAHRAASCR
jgi:hypothetical protein